MITIKKNKGQYSLFNTNEGIAFNYTLEYKGLCDDEYKVINEGYLMQQESISLDLTDGYYILKTINKDNILINEYSFIVLDSILERVIDNFYVLITSKDAKGCINGCHVSDTAAKNFFTLLTYYISLLNNTYVFCVLTKTLNTVLNTYSCDLYKQLQIQFREDCLYGEHTQNPKSVKFIASIYYLVFYYVAIKEAEGDVIELDYINSTYQTKVLFKQIKDCVPNFNYIKTTIDSNYTECSKKDIKVGDSYFLIRGTMGTQRSVTITKNILFSLRGSTGTPIGGLLAPSLPPVSFSSYTNIRINSLPLVGTLKFNGTIIEAGFEFDIANFPTSLTYETTILGNVENHDFFTFQLSEIPGATFYSDIATVRFGTALPLPKAATQIGGNVFSLSYSDKHIFTESNFIDTIPPYLHPDGNPAKSVRIDDLPTYGKLEVYNFNTSQFVPVTAGLIIDMATIGNGHFRYSPPIGREMDITTSFKFSINDVGSNVFLSGGHITFELTKGGFNPDLDSVDFGSFDALFDFSLAFVTQNIVEGLTYEFYASEPFNYIKVEQGYEVDYLSTSSGENIFPNMTTDVISEAGKVYNVYTFSTAVELEEIIYFKLNKL